MVRTFVQYCVKWFRSPHPFQAVVNSPYDPADCFETHMPTIVPARTLFSQMP